MSTQSIDQPKPEASHQLVDEVVWLLDKLWRDVSMIEDVFTDYAFPDTVMPRGRKLKLDDMLEIFKTMRDQTRTLQRYASCL
jgi:hypothetical protein